MLFGYLLLAIALTISVTAAFYSIAGLTAIFAAAFWPIVIMGSVLELGKVVTTVWLHKYWDRAALQFKLSSTSHWYPNVNHLNGYLWIPLKSTSRPSSASR